jgi:hypothetical protein
MTSPFPPPPTASSSTAPPDATRSTTTGAKSVQFADDPPQSYSDTELSTTHHRSPRASRRRRSGKRAESPASEDSDATVELPRRFDDQGRPLRHDSVADAIEGFLLGRNRAGRGFNDAVDQWLGVPRQTRRRSERRQWED